MHFRPPFFVAGSHRLIWALSLAGSLAVGSVDVNAAEDLRHHVPADASWAVVVKVADYLDSRTGGGLTDRYWDERAERWRESMRRDFGMDPLREVDAVILHGPDGDPANGVAVVLGAFKPEGVEQRLRGKDDYRQVEERGQVVHVWNSGAAAYPAEGIAVLGRGKEPVIKAVDVIQGRRSSIGAEALGGMDPRRMGEFLTGFSHEGSLLQRFPPKAAILRHARNVRFSSGEDAEVLWGRFTLEIPEEDVSRQVETIIMGWIGYARLAEEARDPFSLAFRHASVERTNDVVEIRFEVPLDDLPF